MPNDVLINVKANTKDAERGLEGARRSVEGFASSLKGLFVGLGASALAVGAFNLAKSAAQAESVGIAFKNMAGNVGASSDEMLAAMQRASSGTVARTDLMLAANRAMALGVASTTQDMVTLMEIARKKGQQMGLDTTQAFDNLVTGLGRASPMILDNLGIAIKVGAANEQYAKSLGKTVEALTEAERKQALVNAVVSQGRADIAATGGAADTAADSFARLTVATQEVKEGLGRALLPVLTPLIEGIAGVFSQLLPTRKEMAAIDDIARSSKKSLSDYHVAWDEVAGSISKARAAMVIAMPQAAPTGRAGAIVADIMPQILTVQQQVEEFQKQWEGSFERMTKAQMPVVKMTEEMGRQLAIARDIDISWTEYLREREHFLSGATEAVNTYAYAWEQWAQQMDTMSTGPMLAIAERVLDYGNALFQAADETDRMAEAQARLDAVARMSMGTFATVADYVETLKGVYMDLGAQLFQSADEFDRNAEAIGGVRAVARMSMGTFATVADYVETLKGVYMDLGAQLFQSADEFDRNAEAIGGVRKEADAAAQSLMALSQMLGIGSAAYANALTQGATGGFGLGWLSGGGDLVAAAAAENARLREIAQAPRYAAGGVVTRPTLAVVGEAGPEAVVPLRGGSGGGINVTVPVYLDGRVIAEVLGRAAIHNEQVRSS